MSLIGEFKKFAMRGNVVDLAVGVIIGASFTGIVNSLVNDVIMPPIGLALGGVDFANFFIVLKGDHALDTLAAAKAAKAVTLNYGLFINAIINFLIVAFALCVVSPTIGAQPDKHGEMVYVGHDWVCGTVWHEPGTGDSEPPKKCCCCAISATA